MKKRIRIPLVFINMLLIAGLLAAFFVIVASPFHPWDKLYVFQSNAERIALRLRPGDTQRASFAVDLAERRLADLAMAANPAQIQAAGVAFDVAMQDVADVLEKADFKSSEELYTRLRIMLMQTKIIIEKIDPYINVEIVDLLYAKVQLSIDLQDREQIRNAWASTVPPQAIPFLGDGFTVADHTTYRLDGHYKVECLACHDDGIYKGTHTECDQCHEAPKSQPRLGNNRRTMFVSLVDFSLEGFEDHYVGKCSECHTTYSWEPVAFDHQYYEGCLGCHENDLPELYVRPDFSVKLPHYDGECFACHQDTSDWSVADYPHSEDNFEACLGCHEFETPDDHYPDFTCLACHQVENWDQLAFDHDGMENCSTCHLADKPSTHYPGQCSNCHTSESWAYTGHPDNPNCDVCHDFGYHKTGSKCSMCHEMQNHYPGTCSDCHTTDDWDPTKFSHRNNSDCESCHSTPATHYPGNCLQCHSYDLWENVEVQHSDFDMECIECHNTPTGHYPGLCWQCHNSTNWNEIDVQHGAFNLDCQTCHGIPDAHYPGLCWQCHNVTDWDEIDVQHNLFDEACITCHTTPTAHYPGECFWCHNSGDWGDVVPDHGLIMEYTDSCTTCHVAPEGHWPGECADCHISDVDWQDYEFDHTGYTDCNACHIDDRPAGHPRGKCSNCHDTDSWDISDDPTPTGTIFPEGENEEDDEEATETPMPTLDDYDNFTATPTNEATVTPDSEIILTPTPPTEVTVTVEPTSEF